MTFKIKIINLSETHFSLNNDNPLVKGVYLHKLDGDRVGLYNKFSRSDLIEPTHFSNYAYSTGDSFSSLGELVEYLKTYIEVTGQVDPITTPSFQEKLFNKMEEILEVLQEIRENTAPQA